MTSFFAAAHLAGQAAKRPPNPSEATRYADPTTEWDVYRLTGPAHSDTLPAYYNRAITRNSASLLFASDRTGAVQAYRMELRTAETHQLTDVEDLDASSLTFTPDNRTFCYFAGRSLFATALAAMRERKIYEVPEEWERCPGVSVGPDGTHATFAESRGDTSRLRMVTLGQGVARTVTEAPFPIAHPIHRPMRAQILFRQGDDSLWLVNSDGQQKRQLKLAPGKIGSPNWSPDGKTVFYLNFPEDTAQLRNIREYSPDAGTDKMVSKTSQFACFGFNRDSSVFVGASANQGSPTLLILLRITRRELTLCEHKATHPESVAPMFSPDSQRIYFQSDREGRSALYDLHVERLVEKTASDTA
jgi:oligogalacturonide lyase